MEYNTNIDDTKDVIQGVNNHVTFDLGLQDTSVVTYCVMNSQTGSCEIKHIGTNINRQPVRVENRHQH